MKKVLKIIIGLLILYLVIGIIVSALAINELEPAQLNIKDAKALIFWPQLLSEYLKCGSFICFEDNLWPL